MERIVITALIQTSVSEDMDRNLHGTASKVREAAKSGANIVCLQELFRTIYFPQYRDVDIDAYAETIPGESTELFSGIAREEGIIIIVPLFEKTSSGFFNSAAVIDTDGTITGIYRKTHIPFDPLFYEKDYFKEGKSDYPVFRTSYGVIGILICYDQWFPEAARIETLKGAEIIFYPTAIGWIRDHRSRNGDWQEAWETIQRAHAIANGVHIAAVNRTGTEDRLQFWGGSFVCDAFGKIIEKAGSHTEEVLLARIDLNMNKRVQEGWGFLRNRRPDTYLPLCSKLEQEGEV